MRSTGFFPSCLLPLAFCLLPLACCLLPIPSFTLYGELIASNIF
ncbi:hypothetical protein [Moorena sp. SIO3B2]|nr:hypothetical protein [Moorena sp. SIO3B2]